MISSSHPHDDFFKLVFSKKEVIKSFIEEFMPDLKIDSSYLTLIPTEKNTKYKRFFLDLAFKTKYKDKDAQIYIVFEHKSYPDKTVYFQILNYALSIWQEEKENLTPIIPVIFYHGKKHFELKNNFDKLFSINTPYNLNLPFKVINLTKIEDKKLLECSNNLFLCSALYTMKHIFDNLQKLKPIALNFSKMSKDEYYLIVEYISNFKEEKEETVLDEILPKEQKMTIMEKWKKEARERGMQEGLQQGLEKGMQQGMQQGLQQGLLQGEKKGILKGKILAFLEIGINIDEIAKKLNIEKKEIENILKEK